MVGKAERELEVMFNPLSERLGCDHGHSVSLLLSVFLISTPPAHETVSFTFRVGFPSGLTPFSKCPHGHAHGCVS